MLTNADCTVFNRTLDKSTRMDVWYRTYIRGVYWESSKAAKRERTNGITADSALFAAIPKDAEAEGKSFLPPNEYKSASPETAFTFAPEDIIVKGIIPENIGENFSIADLNRKYSDVYIITECKDLRFGGLPHIEVSGK